MRFIAIASTTPICVTTHIFKNDMATKRKAAAMAAVEEAAVDPADELMFLNLGGGNEVGRSCHIVQYKGKTVMVSEVATNGICHTNISLARRWSACRL